jgi:hypothetical protein
MAARPARQGGVPELAESRRRGPVTDAGHAVMFGRTQFAVR